MLKTNTVPDVPEVERSPNSAPGGLAMASEAEIVFNRANVALARSQRLIASWLPPKTTDEIANEKTEEELQREEDEIFTAVPEK